MTVRPHVAWEYSTTTKYNKVATGEVTSPTATIAFVEYMRDQAAPAGLESAMTRLAPLHLGSFIMGAWFYMTAVGNFVAGKIGESTGGEGGTMSKELTLSIYNEIGWITIGVAVVVLALSPIVKRWMHLDTLEDRPATKAE